ncbi:rhs family domain protein, partial [Vibrio parahaemolyticus EKP-021]
NKGALLNC